MEGDGSVQSTEERGAERSMDDYLRSIGLHRKKIAKDGSCLFRAVAEQVLHCQSLHSKVRAQCVEFLKENRSSYEAFIEGDFDDYLLKLQDPQQWVGEVEISALAVMYKRDFLIFQEVGKPAVNITDNNFKEKVQLVFLNGNHYDSVYPISRFKSAALCQSILYELLYDGVFKVDRSSLGLCQRTGRPSDLLSDDSMNACVSSDESDLDVGDALWVENETSTTASRHNSQSYRGRGRGRQLPERVRRSLNPTLFRNVEFDVWHKTKRAQQKMDYSIAAGMQFTVGDRCQVRLDGGGRVFSATIREISPNNGPVTVYLEELGTRKQVPLWSLRPPSDETSWSTVVNRDKRLSNGHGDWEERAKGRGRGKPVPGPSSSSIPSLLGSGGRKHHSWPLQATVEPQGGAKANRKAALSLESAFGLTEKERLAKEEEERNVALVEIQLRDEHSFPALGTQADGGKWKGGDKRRSQRNTTKSPVEDVRAASPSAGERPNSSTPPPPSTTTAAATPTTPTLPAAPTPTTPTLPAAAAPTTPTLPAAPTPTTPTLPAAPTPTTPTLPAAALPTTPTFPAAAPLTTPTLPAAAPLTTPTLPAAAPPTTSTLPAAAAPTTSTLPAAAAPPTTSTLPAAPSATSDSNSPAFSLPPACAAPTDTTNTLSHAAPPPPAAAPITRPPPPSIPSSATLLLTPYLPAASSPPTPHALSSSSSLPPLSSVSPPPPSSSVPPPTFIAPIAPSPTAAQGFLPRSSPPVSSLLHSPSPPSSSSSSSSLLHQAAPPVSPHNSLPNTGVTVTTPQPFQSHISTSQTQTLGENQTQASLPQNTHILMPQNTQILMPQMQTEAQSCVPHLQYTEVVSLPQTQTQSPVLQQTQYLSQSQCDVAQVQSPHPAPGSSYPSTSPSSVQPHPHLHLHLQAAQSPHPSQVPHPFVSLYTPQTQNTQNQAETPLPPAQHPESPSHPPQPPHHPQLQSAPSPHHQSIPGAVPLQQLSQLYHDPLYPGFPQGEKGDVAPTPPFSSSQSGDDLPRDLNILRFFFNLGVKAYSMPMFFPYIYLYPLQQAHTMHPKLPSRSPSPTPHYSHPQYPPTSAPMPPQYDHQASLAEPPHPSDPSFTQAGYPVAQPPPHRIPPLSWQQQQMHPPRNYSAGYSSPGPSYRGPPPLSQGYPQAQGHPLYRPYPPPSSLGYQSPSEELQVSQGAMEQRPPPSGDTMPGQGLVRIPGLLESPAATNANRSMGALGFGQKKEQGDGVTRVMLLVDPPLNNTPIDVSMTTTHPNSTPCSPQAAYDFITKTPLPGDNIPSRGYRGHRKPLHSPNNTYVPPGPPELQGYLPTESLSVGCSTEDDWEEATGFKPTTLNPRGPRRSQRGRGRGGHDPGRGGHRRRQGGEAGAGFNYLQFNPSYRGRGRERGY